MTIGTAPDPSPSVLVDETLKIQYGAFDGISLHLPRIMNISRGEEFRISEDGEAAIELTPAKYQFLIQAQASRAKSELELVRRINTEIRSEQLMLKPETTYLVKFKSAAPQSSWSMLRIFDVETEKEFIRKGIENWGPSFAEVFKVQQRFTGGTSTVGMNTAGNPLLSLTFSGTENPLTDEDLRMISTLTGAVELHLSNLTGFSEQGLVQLGQCKGLESLAVGSLDMISDAFLNGLEGDPNLHTLSVGGDRITDKAISSLEKLPQLRRLGFVKSNVTDKGIRTLADLESLEELSIIASDIRGDGFAAFKNHKRLRYLQLGNCTSLDEKRIVALGDITSLKVLEFSQTNMRLDIAERLKKSRADLLVSISGSASESWVDGVLDMAIPRLEYPGETPLSEVLDGLSQFYEATVSKKLVFAWESGDKGTPAKSATGLSQITVSNIALDTMTLRQALTEILAAAPNHKLTFQVSGDMIVISPE